MDSLLRLSIKGKSAGRTKGVSGIPSPHKPGIAPEIFCFHSIITHPFGYHLGDEFFQDCFRGIFERNSLVPRLRDDVFGSMNGRVKAIASLFSGGRVEAFA
jgi:hypothetical protein